MQDLSSATKRPYASPSGILKAPHADDTHRPRCDLSMGNMIILIIVNMIMLINDSDHNNGNTNNHIFNSHETNNDNDNSNIIICYAAGAHDSVRCRESRREGM